MTEHIRDRNQVELHSTCSALLSSLAATSGLLYLAMRASTAHVNLPSASIWASKPGRTDEQRRQGSSRPAFREPTDMQACYAVKNKITEAHAPSYLVQELTCLTLCPLATMTGDAQALQACVILQQAPTCSVYP